MRGKNLNLRYLIFFITIFFLIILIMGYLKESSFKKEIIKTQSKIDTKYKEQYKNLESICEFIYFNEIIKSKKIVKIFKNNKNMQKLKEELYDEFEPEFSYYKTLGVFDISFYDIDSFMVLNFQDINFKDRFTSYLVKDKKEKVEYKTIKDEVFIFFSKPIFDDELNILGTINIEFNFNKILDKLNDNSKLIYKKSLSNSFDTNLDIFKILNQKQKDELTNALEKNENISFIFDDNLRKKSFILYNIFNSNYYKNSLYLLVYSSNEDETINKIDNFYNSIFLVILVFLVIVFFLIYFLLRVKEKNRLIKRDFDELYKQIDENVLKLDIDLKGNIVYATSCFLETSGYSKEEIVGKNSSILRHPDMSINFYKTLWSELENLKTWQGEIKNRDKFGNTYWVKSTLFPKFNIAGEHIGYSSIRVDITDAKQAEKANRLLKDDLSNRLSELRIKDKNLIDSTKVLLMSKILDSFSHQWKFPISKISYEIQRLSSAKKDILKGEDLDEAIKTIDFELKKLSDLLNDTKSMFVSKTIENGELLTIVNQVIVDLKTDSQKYNVEINNYIEDSIMLKIFPNELRNIVLSLLMTILEQVKLYDIKNCKVYIELVDDLNNNELIVKISENISNNYKKNYINEFLNSTDDRFFDSTLYLAKLIIEKNDGLFWCKNQDSGATYYIKLKKV